MRRFTLTLLATAVAFLLAGTALVGAATAISLSTSPRVAARGESVTLRGAGWAVIEFCAPRVTLTLSRAAPFGPLPIATVRLRTGARNSGTFALTWRVPPGVHSGPRTIVATQRCTSGKDGSAVLVSRATTLRVR